MDRGYFSLGGQALSEQVHALESVEELRPELTAYCYRMLGSIFDADDAVQDTLTRAWQNLDQFRQDSSLRYWIYRIATNVCLDQLRSAKRRALPMDLSDPTHPIVVPRETVSLTEWIWPLADTQGDPADMVIRKDTIRLAFIAALQLLPPRQRAVLVLHDVFHWSASETSVAMEMSTVAVNSALQRARATMSRAKLRSDGLRQVDTEIDHQLLDQYVEAFERYDITELITLFREDGSLSMPPFCMWVHGRTNLASFYEATRWHCLGSRLISLKVNGNTPAFAQYAPSSDGTLTPWGVHVLELKDRQIAHVHTFIDAALYPRFGLPTRL